MKEFLVFLSTVLSPMEVEAVELFGFNILADRNKAHYACMAWRIRKDELRMVRTMNEVDVPIIDQEDIASN